MRLITNKNPSLTCLQDNDKYTVNSTNGNGKLTYPVGLLSADELAYAGAVDGTSNTSYYLYTNQKWWTLSSGNYRSGNVDVFVIYDTGALFSEVSTYYYNCDVSTFSYGIRPSVSLKLGTSFTSGNGTANSPYIVE